MQVQVLHTMQRAYLINTVMDNASQYVSSHLAACWCCQQQHAHT